MATSFCNSLRARSGQRGERGAGGGEEGSGREGGAASGRSGTSGEQEEWGAGGARGELAMPLTEENYTLPEDVRALKCRVYLDALTSCWCTCCSPPLFVCFCSVHSKRVLCSTGGVWQGVVRARRHPGV